MNPTAAENPSAYELIGELGEYEATTYSTLATILEAVCGPDRIPVTISDYPQSYSALYQIGEEIEEAMEKDESLDKPLDEAFAKIVEITGNDPAKNMIVLMDSIEMGEEFDSDEAIKIFKWVESRSKGYPFSELALDLAMTFRLNLSAAEELPDDFPEVKNPDAYKAHFEKRIREAMSFHHKGIAPAFFHLLVGYGSFDNFFSKQCTIDLARHSVEILNDETSPILSTCFATVMRHFAMLPPNEETKKIAALLPEAWREKNRYNANESHPKAFNPGDDENTAIFRVLAKYEKPEDVSSFFGRFRNNLDETDALMILIENGHDELALRFLKQNEFEFSTPDDSRFTPDLAKRLPAFLEKIEDLNNRFYIETVIKSAYNPGRRYVNHNEKDGPSPRELRIQEMARRLESEDIPSPVLEKSLEILEDFPIARRELSGVFKEIYEDADVRLISLIQDYSSIRDSLSTPGFHVIEQARVGNLEPAKEFFPLVGGYEKRTYTYSMLRDFSRAFRTEIASALQRKKLDEAKNFMQVQREMIRSLDDYHFRNCSYLSDYIGLIAVAGWEEESGWIETLPEDRRKKLRKLLEGKIYEIAISVYTFADDDLPYPERFAILKRLFSDRFVRESLAESDFVLRSFISRGFLDLEEIDGKEKELAELFPREGRAGLDLAQCYVGEGKWDKAIAACALADQLNPGNGEIALRTTMTRADILYSAKRKEVAIAELEDVAVEEMSENLYKDYAILCKRLKIKPRSKPNEKGEAEESDE